MEARLLAHGYFGQPPPKSLDRDEFAWLAAALVDAAPADGAATLTRCTAAAGSSAWNGQDNPSAEPATANNASVPT